MRIDRRVKLGIEARRRAAVLFASGRGRLLFVRVNGVLPSAAVPVSYLLVLLEQRHVHKVGV